MEIMGSLAKSVTGRNKSLIKGLESVSFFHLTNKLFSVIISTI